MRRGVTPNKEIAEKDNDAEWQMRRRRGREEMQRRHKLSQKVGGEKERERENNKETSFSWVESGRVMSAKKETALG